MTTPCISWARTNCQYTIDGNLCRRVISGQVTMDAKQIGFFLVIIACLHVSAATSTGTGNMCAMIQAQYVRSGEDPLCTYFRCTGTVPLSQNCPPGLRVDSSFLYGNDDPCTREDLENNCP